VLDEFFRTGAYRPRGSAETFETSSPSMDISKASNFERFVFDLLGRDGERTREMFKAQLEKQGFFQLSPAEFDRISAYGFVSGHSTHADHLATIRETWKQSGMMIDTHTADGLKVAREFIEPGVPMIVLETALPAKFAETIVEALGREPDRPPALRGIEALPKRFKVMPADAVAVKTYIAENT
jgi:threonine synthase